MSESEYVIEPPPRAAHPVADSDKLFPVHRIYCIGQNYAAHAREMGSDPERQPPFFFQKNPDNLVSDGRFPYPQESNNVHHEIELVVALKKGGTGISPEAALDRVFGYAAGLDFTRRDLQLDAKSKGQPWATAKAFEASAPTSHIVPVERCGHPRVGAISLAVNGAVRQSGDLSQMIWDVAHQIAFLSKLFTLVPGDMIFTGTPSGVGPVVRGDKLRGEIAGVGKIDVSVV